MIHGKYIGQGEDLTAVKKIRAEVFDGTEYDLHEEFDDLSINVIADTDESIADVRNKTDIDDSSAENEELKDGRIYAACGRLVLDIENDRFYADNICVLKEYRGRHYAEFVLRMLADKANECMAEYLWTDVSKSAAKPFFEKMFFKEYEGNLMRAKLEDFHGCCHKS